LWFWFRSGSVGMDHILFKVEILSNEDREWHESLTLVLGPDDPVEAVLGEITVATVTILDQEASGSLILPATPIVRRSLRVFLLRPSDFHRMRL